DGAVAALRLTDAAGRQDEIDGAEGVLNAVGMMLDAARMEQKTGLGGAPPLGGLTDRAFGNTSDISGARDGPLPTVLRDCVEPDSQRVDEVVIEPVVFDHHLQDRGKQRGVASRLDRQVEIAGTRNRRYARILDDDLRALFARLPQVIGGDWRALGDVRTRDPDHFAADHVGPWVRRTNDAERFLVR